MTHLHLPRPGPEGRFWIGMGWAVFFSLPVWGTVGALLWWWL